MRGRMSSKSETCTESLHVYGAGISGKVRVLRSRSAGERVKESITGFLERRLGLKVNEEKSAVDRPWKRKFLGYTMTWHLEPRIKVAESSVKRLKVKLREILRQGRGRNIGRLIEEELTPLQRGWLNYFRLADVDCQNVVSEFCHAERAELMLLSGDGVG